MEYTILSLAVALIIGLLLSRLTKLLHLPAVTAYLVAGLLLGPFCLGQLGVNGLGFVSEESLSSLGVLTKVALGFIAFSMGNEFRLSALKTMGKQAIVIGVFQAVFTTILVDLVLIGLHFAFPHLLSLPAAIVLGAIASATAPAATLMVVRQYKAHGPLTKLLLLVVAIDDAVGLLLFSASFGIATALETEKASLLGILVEPTLEILFSLLLGAATGFLLTQVERLFHSRGRRMTISVAFVLLTVALSLLKFQIGEVQISFSLLLACMVTGTVFCNTCDFSEELMERVESWAVPINVLFFVISGAELNLSVITHPTTLIIGIVYILSRSTGKCVGAYTSCRMTKCSESITRHLGITLLPQAGVALGMALTVSNLECGPLLRNVILFSVLIYELVGPALTRLALVKAGEIRPEGKTNARIKNAEKAPLSLK